VWGRSNLVKQLKSEEEKEKEKETKR